jgi:signal transduction histidine kinase
MSRTDPGRVGRLRLQQWFAILVAAVGTVTLIGLLVGIFAILQLADARDDVVNKYDPASLTALRLSQALLDQETGVRGFALTGQDSSLSPYRNGLTIERRAARELRAMDVTAGLTDVEQRADRWRRGYADAAVGRVRAGGPRAVRPRATARGKALFDEVRRAIATQQGAIATAREDARDRLASSARFLAGAFILLAVLLVIAGVSAGVFLSRHVARPVVDLGHSVRRVARGEFDHVIDTAGPRDIIELGDDVESMRARIVSSISDLERSNAELEQFAYVASHDLQEPLRKVASFCQLIEKRYSGQLDERGEQYIYFAVDGAKRMQVLINDLLAFSRVGRLGGEFGPVDLDDVLARVLSNLDTAIQESGAVVESEPLPTVNGEASLLGAVLQNLIANGIKFRSDAPPRVSLSAERRGGEWLFSCADNGIGIDPEYAERVFVIFQRLHPKEEYAGTGIGLAMCRKIVDYHGGSIWLDTETTSGTTFHFTLPAIEETA